MKYNFDHFVITRFNLKSAQSNWKTDKNNSETLSDEWLEHRINLFKSYCLPSLIHQSNKNFTWLIYFDSDTPDKYKKIIESLLGIYKSFILPKYVSSYDKFLTSYTQDVLDLLHSEREFVITTRIDNDDVLHEDYIDIVQKQFANQKFMAVNCIKIYHYNIVKPERLFINYTFSNQFISLIEKISNKNITGCYARGDRFWNNKGEVIQIGNGVYCMELIHNKNLLNDLCGFPVLGKKDLTGFQLINPVQNISMKDCIMIWKMSWKKYFIYLAKYK